MNGLRFRFLLPEEFIKLEPQFKEHDWALPHPSISSIRVAEDEAGKIVGFVAFELMAHLGPGWIETEHRTNPTIWEDALNSMREKLEPEGVFPGIIMIAETEASERLAERLGMKKANGVLYVKEWR